MCYKGWKPTLVTKLEWMTDFADGKKITFISLPDRYAADVFGLTYREFLEIKPTHYRWNKIAPETVEMIRSSLQEKWSKEKLADQLACTVAEVAISLERFKMSENVNQKQNGQERIRQLFHDWLGRFDPDESEKKRLSIDLARLLASQLQLSMAQGETLEDLALGLEGEENDSKPQPGSAGNHWGPQWKD